LATIIVVSSSKTARRYSSESNSETMSKKRRYFSPVVKVVELTTKSVLLEGSPTATLGGYEYEDDGWTD
jgi:hypothetical protein